MNWQSKQLKNIYIIENMSMWKALNLDGYNKSYDLVLTYDLELYKYLESNGGIVDYFDHLVDSETMEKNNYRIYNYFAKWNLDHNGKDLLCHKGVDFGFSFRLEFWNDYISYVRLFLSALFVKNLDFNKLYLCCGGQIENIFHEISVDFIPLVYKSNTNTRDGFYFPIEKWLDHAIRPTGLRKGLLKTREFIVRIFGNIKIFLAKLYSSNKSVVFYQSYHPTADLIDLAISQGRHKVLLENFTRTGSIINKFKQHTVPVSNNIDGLKVEADRLMFELKKGVCHKLNVSLNNQDFDITAPVNQLIFKRVDQALENKLRLLESSISYLNQNRVDLIVLTANIGALPTIFHLVCKSRGIPSYMIINGLMISNYLDEAKYATYINSYSISIKENYFQQINDVVAIGDPRMDLYTPTKIKDVNRVMPTIVIGASGFDSIDLNSYTAVEFDFMYDICKAIEEFNYEVKIVIKVRPNGYKNQYIDFIAKYFSNLKVSVIDKQSMQKVLGIADLYISIYSQTLFEASCMGIPVIYYKKDTQVLNAPFDGKSELVTVCDIPSLICALNDFQKSHVRFNAFLDKTVMEKYVGPLDGKNLERNINFIDTLLK